MDILKPLVVAMIAVTLSCVLSHAQEQVKPAVPKVENPETIPPTTSCEGITGALPEAIPECRSARPRACSSSWENRRPR